MGKLSGFTVEAMMFTDREIEFISQKDLFVQKALQMFAQSDISIFRNQPRRDAAPVRPTVIKDYTNLSIPEIESIERGYFSFDGVSSFIVLNAEVRSSGIHPLLIIADQLKDVLPLRYPVTHPMEGHSEAVKRFGTPDGTLKIYDLERDRPDNKGYREVAETSEQFDAHSDGLGYGGAVEVFSLYADAAPLWGGYTYFQNMIGLSLALYAIDEAAFNSLFLPDAITALRPRGKGAIKVSSPCLYLNEHCRPQVFFRISTGEYKISWREGNEDLQRARAFFERHARPFAPGSTFVQMNKRGSGCFARNEQVIHGRTAFLDGNGSEDRRVLARKWFMSAAEHASYKHVPGMHIYKPYAELFPDMFGQEMLEGDWNYDINSNRNIRIA